MEKTVTQNQTAPAPTVKWETLSPDERAAVMAMLRGKVDSLRGQVLLLEREMYRKNGVNTNN